GQQVLRFELLWRRLRVLLAAAWPPRLVSRARRDALHCAVACATDLVRHALAIDGVARVAAHDPTAAAEQVRLLGGLRDAASSVAPLLAAQRGPIAADRSAARTAARTRAAALRVASAAASGRQPLLPA